MFPGPSDWVQTPLGAIVPSVVDTGTQLDDATNHGQPVGRLRSLRQEEKGRRAQGVFGFWASPTGRGPVTQTPRFGQTPAQRRAGERGMLTVPRWGQHPHFVTLPFWRAGRLLEAPGLGLPGRYPAPSPGLRGLPELPEAPGPRRRAAWPASP